MDCSSWICRLYAASGWKRAVIVWMVMMLVLWGSFGLATLVYPAAFAGETKAPGAGRLSGVALFGYIVLMNGVVLLLVAGGNLFARFGVITPGLVVLLWQGVQIGWMAGSNGFETPFATMLAANLAFLRVGLWETSAYALVCAVTLPKSLLISKTFPPKEWSEQRQWSDIRLDRQEMIVVMLAVLMWLGAAISETLVVT